MSDPSIHDLEELENQYEHERQPWWYLTNIRRIENTDDEYVPNPEDLRGDR